MKLAVVDQYRKEAEPGLIGTCTSCGSAMVAKCGEIRVWHWAHRGRRHCDPWWENETEWHRSWKNRFPSHWQEIVHTADTGERHIADVKTEFGWVLEFQHSHLNPAERRSRDCFYPKLNWVVDGTRRKRDAQQLKAAWTDGMQVAGLTNLRKAYTDGCALLREWAGSTVPTFFDLGEPDILWWKVATTDTGVAYVFRYPRALFIANHIGIDPDGTQKFETLLTEFPRMIFSLEVQQQHQMAVQTQTNAFPGRPGFIRRSRRL